MKTFAAISKLITLSSTNNPLFLIFSPPRILECYQTNHEFSSVFHARCKGNQYEAIKRMYVPSLVACYDSGRSDLVEVMDICVCKCSCVNVTFIYPVFLILVAYTATRTLNIHETMFT